ncbi:hypothetical protein DPMN_064700 [Dreissena polymorpha]|uniref:Uncharacterized protein n=1 Tax=Dreissena polymorpha TaxID=45954 RepID=A0A9D4CCP1_DREPO|nr:hypothetical protein DPMN_064700 [Dreissena polymorpha]
MAVEEKSWRNPPKDQTRSHISRSAEVLFCNKTTLTVDASNTSCNSGRWLIYVSCHQQNKDMRKKKKKMLAIIYGCEKFQDLSTESDQKPFKENISENPYIQHP